MEELRRRTDKLEEKFDKLSEEVTRNIEKIKNIANNQERMENMEQILMQMVKNDERHTTILERLESDIKNQNTAIKELELKPLKRWQLIINTLITCIVTFVATKFLGDNI